MEVRSGSCRFGLWAVNVWWSGDIVHSVRFSPAAIPGSAPGAFARFLAGRAGEIPFASIATLPDAPYRAVYEAVASIPYGSVASYGEIGRIAGTSARVVGLAMKRNPTPLVIPCHRVTGARGIGGFTPSVDIKRELLSMEQKYRGQPVRQDRAPGRNWRRAPAAAGREGAIGMTTGLPDGPAGKTRPKRSAVILVGGEGRRVNGLEKYFFLYKGETFISRLVGGLRDVVDEIVLVARSQEQCRRFAGIGGITCTADIRCGIGPVGGLHSGALTASGEHIFVTACDMPCVNPAVVSALFSVIGDYDAVIPSWNPDMIEPLHAVYRREAVLAYLTAHEGESLRSMIRHFRVKYVDAAAFSGIDPGLRTFININRMAELERINNDETHE